MEKLNLPAYPVKLKKAEGKTWIFDDWRKKFLVLTPEAWVRQHFIHFLVNQHGYPSSLIAVESGLKVASRLKRTDAVVFNKQGKPVLIIECKAPEIKITEQVFDQIVRYNMSLQVKFLVVTNGMQHYCCLLNYNDNSWTFLNDIPPYDVLT